MFFIFLLILTLLYTFTHISILLSIHISTPLNTHISIPLSIHISITLRIHTPNPRNEKAPPFDMPLTQLLHHHHLLSHRLNLPFQHPLLLSQTTSEHQFASTTRWLWSLVLMGVKGVLQQGRECGREKRVGVRRRWIDKQKLVRARVCEVIAEDEIGGGDVCERRILEKKPLAGELNEIRRMAEKRHFFHAMNGLLLSA